jgi:hypothetical protein
MVNGMVTLFKTWMNAITKVIRKGELLRMENYFTTNEKWIHLHLSKIFQGETNRLSWSFMILPNAEEENPTRLFCAAFSFDIASVVTPRS